MEHPKKSYYPSYDVLNQKEKWDDVTQRVIEERISPLKQPFLTPEEKELLASLQPLLFPSHLGEISIDILTLFENRCAQGKLNGFPKGSKQSKLSIIRNGMQHLIQQTFVEHKTTFSKLKKEQQLNIIDKLEKNQGYLNIWQDLKPNLFFKTLLKELISIVYSDPSIWSDIGYGGPAFPRGYYSFGPKQFDQWEAKMHADADEDDEN